MTKDSEEILGSRDGGLRSRINKDLANHVRNDFAPVLKSVQESQMELQTCVRQIKTLLDLQQEPWKKAGTMLWGMVLGVFLFALLQPRIQHTHDTCTLGKKIIDALPTLSEHQRSLIEKIVHE